MKKEVLMLGFFVVFLASINFISSADCTTNWQCSNWSDCIDNTQIRNCYDINLCGVSEGKPEERQTCGTVCNPDWQCSNWDPSGCNETQLQKRTCTDLNNCNRLENKPEEALSCDFNKDYSWIYFFIVAIMLVLIIGAIWLLIKKLRN